ncbi:MAG: DUF2207 domain-containing protein [Candidatus Aenigmarchaeota archaeon]|nr:DUF2207 domain-containing protein [Candidatus Aenigmarchaeota archaeon]
MRKYLLVTLVLLLIPVIYSKSYYYDSIFLNMDFYGNGTALVEQIRDYHFDGDFSWAYIDFKKIGADDVNVIDVIDMRSGDSVPFTVEENSRHTEVRWDYSAHNENIKFKIIYSIEGAVNRYEDVSEFYWKLVEEEHERIEYFQVDVNLPESSSDLFKVFVHTQGIGKDLVFFNQNSSARFMVEDVPKDTFVEVRMLTEPDIFSEVKITPKKNYEDILDDEERIFDGNPPTRFRRLSIISMLGNIVFLGVPILTLFYFYFRYGVEPKVEYQGIYEHDPPMDIPPMALVAVLDKPKPSLQMSAKGLMATLFDFAVRGFLVIKEEKKKFLLFESTSHKFELTKKGQDPKLKEKLTPFEWKIFKLFFFQISDDNKTVNTAQIRSWTKKQTTFKKKLLSFSKSAKSWFERKHFKIYVKQSEKARKKYLIFLLISGVLGFIFGGFLSLFFYLPVMVVLYLFSGTISKRTTESTLQVKKWKAFKKFITHFSEMEDAPTTLLQIWDRYLVYAVVLGVAEKLLENLKDFAVKTDHVVSGVGWYYGADGLMRGTISPQQFSVLSNNLSSTISSMTATSGAFSASTSTGGGFSGGGGGGGGGGGSGAG